LGQIQLETCRSTVQNREAFIVRGSSICSYTSTSAKNRDCMDR